MRFNDKLKLYGNVRIKSSIFNIITNNFELKVKKEYFIKIFSLFNYIYFSNLYNIFIILKKI